MIKTTGIELWEIMKDGKNGEVFEVAECNVHGFNGTKIQVKETFEKGSRFKCLVNPNIKGEGAESLATLYGCLGTAKFRKVQEYEDITLIEAIERMQDYKLVYIRHMGEYKELTRYDDFSDFHVDGMSDLMVTTFYKKGE